MSNSLSAVHPELIAEWSEKNLPLTPDNVTFGSNKKVWWKGACGHEWETSVKARSNGEKCPICSGARVVAGINDLSTLKPELASEWSEENEIKPTEVSIGSHKKVIWKCKLGHEWIATVKSRTINRTGCPYCSHNKVLAGFNDLATLFPEVADEWSDKNEKKSTEVMAFANSKAWWKCRTCDYEWNTLISTRSGGSKCPCCIGYIYGIDECWLDVTGSSSLKGDGLLIAQEISRRMKSELGVTVSVGVSFNKIFAKLGSDYKKPDAITTMYKSEFKQKAWSLPVADLLYVGKSTNRKLALFGIKTIGDLARADEDVLNSHLGKMGSILWSFANGYDDSPVKLENTHAPIKSVGNSTTTPKDLVCDEDVKIVLYILAESVAARLRENGFRCRVVEISVRDNELFSFTRQKKIDHATNITGEIAAYAYQIFKENYNWSKPIRSVGVRGADLVTDNYWEQIDLFSSVEKREKQMKMDSAVDEIRRRFGFYSIQRGLMYRDRILSAVNAKEEHTVHPHGYFG